MKSRIQPFVYLLILMLVSACQPAPAPSPTETIAPTGLPSPAPTRVESQPDSIYAHGDSYSPAITTDGRFVAFVSRGQDLAGGQLADCNDLGSQNVNIPCAGVFVYDRQTAALSLVSVSSQGDPADGDSASPAISADGRWVVFASRAANLDPAHANRDFGVFVHDRQTGETSLISANAIDPSISADGRFVAFNQLGDFPSISVYDRQTEKLVDASRSNNPADGASLVPRLSADGRWLAFWSWKSGLVERDEEVCGPSDAYYNCGDVFLYNGATGEMRRVKVSAPYGLGMGHPTLSISADGRLVAFDDQLYDRLQRYTQPLCGRGELACPGGALSANGRVIAYRSGANYFRFERGSDAPVQVDIDAQGQSSDAVPVDFRSTVEGETFEPGFALSADGRFVVFSSTASSLHPDDSASCSNGYFDAHNCYDIYLYDSQSGALEWISH